MKRSGWLSLVALLWAAPGRSALCAETNHSFDKWEEEIAAYDQMDRANPPPQDAVLIIGSSTIRLWKRDGRGRRPRESPFEAPRDLFHGARC